MMRSFLLSIALIGFVQVFACTNFLITNGASTSGHNYIFYANDGAYSPSFPVHKAGIYKNDEQIKIVSWPNKAEGFIPRAKKEYHTIGYHMNEYNVTIGETTFGGREELHNTNEFLEYWHLMELGLQRSKSAREAIEVITSLVKTYGYGSEGESFSIADPKEAWILEMTGKGNDSKGAIWVAAKVPDGYVSAHANHARIGAFDLNDKENFLYSEDVIDFAIEKGYYNPNSGEPFSFCEAYDPVNPAKLRYTEMRVWDFFSRVAPSLNIAADYARGIAGAKRMPLWIKPDNKLSLENIMALTRSHYDGTPWDMEKGLKAGPHGNPNRSRPLTFTVDGVEASWERPISTPLTAYAFIAELKGNKKSTEATLWLGLDNTYTNVYMPFNASVTELPESYNNADYNKFSWDSMWWAFNFVGNYVNLRYVDMIEDVKQKQQELQLDLIQQYQAFELTQTTINDNNTKAENFTNFSQNRSEELLKNWIELSHHLMVKYNDGLVRDQDNRTQSKGYSDDFYRKAIDNDKERILPVWETKSDNKEPRNY